MKHGWIFFGDTWQLRGKIKFNFGDVNIQSHFMINQ